MPPAQGSSPTLPPAGPSRLGLGNANIAGQGDFQTTAHGKAVDGGDGDAAKVRQGLEGLSEHPRHGARGSRVAVGKQLEVRARGKEFLTLAGDHQRIDILCLIQLRYQVAKCRQALRIPGVRRRVVDSQLNRVALLLQLKLGRCTCQSSDDLRGPFHHQSARRRSRA